MAQLKRLLNFNIQRKEFLPVIISFLLLGLFELFFWRSNLFYYCLALAVLAFFFTLWQFHLSDIEKRKWGGFVILPPLFILGLAVYSSMLVRFSFWQKFFIHFLFLFNAIFFYLYLRFSYFYFLKPYIFKEADFKNLSLCGSYLSSFFLFSSLYGLPLFLSIDFWFFLPFVFLIVFLLAIQFLWLEKIEIKKNMLYILIICLILAEIYWALAFLPLKYSVCGLILSLIFFIIINLTKFSLLGNLSKEIIRNYLVFGIGAIIIVLLTARWA